MIDFYRFNSRSLLIRNISNASHYSKALNNELTNIQEVIPSYNEILIVFNKEISDVFSIKNQIQKVLKGNTKIKTSPHINLPICFDLEFAIDSDRIKKHTGLKFSDVIDSICTNIFTVSFLGFLPGFPYLSGLSNTLEIPRHNSPRNRIEAGSFAIAKDQVGIYPNPSPAGWNILGNCPIPMFDINRKETTLLRPGDRVSFYSISKKEHTELKDQLFIRNSFLK